MDQLEELIRMLCEDLESSNSIISQVVEKDLRRCQTYPSFRTKNKHSGLLCFVSNIAIVIIENVVI